MQGGERLPAAVFCHGTEGADIGFAPKHLEAGHPELDIGIRAGDRIVEVDDAVVGVDDVDRRIGQAVEDVAGGFVTFAQKAGGAALPDVLPDDFGHEDEGVHFLLRPYAAVAALLEADMADHVPVAHDVALEERGDGVVEDERFFFRGDFRKIAAIIDAAGVPCFGQLDFVDGDVLELLLGAPFRIGAPFMRDADGLPVERVFKDENLVHAQGVSDEMQRLVDPFVHVVHAEEDINDVHHDAVADGVDGEGRGCLDAVGVSAGGLAEEFVTVFAVPFGVVQGDVGLPEQILIGDGTLGNGDAHADGDGVVDIAVFKQVADGGAEGLRACADTRDFRNVAHVDVEFVAAHAPDDVVLPEGAPKLAGDFHDDGVPGEVPHAVVDVLEIVDVDHEQHAGTAGPCVAQGDADFLFGRDLVVKPGHGVGAALIKEPELFALLPVDVAQRAHGFDGLAEGVQDVGAVEGEPALAA